MRISDWSSDVCSSDLQAPPRKSRTSGAFRIGVCYLACSSRWQESTRQRRDHRVPEATGGVQLGHQQSWARRLRDRRTVAAQPMARNSGKSRLRRSEEHTSDLQSLMRISYAVFCLKKKNKTNNIH